MGRRFSILTLFLMLTFHAFSYGQNALKVRSVNGGSYSWLLDQSINCITQDNSGYIWISTYGGILRYDGSEFLLMTHNPKDPSSLSDNGPVPEMELTISTLIQEISSMEDYRNMTAA